MLLLLAAATPPPPVTLSPPAGEILMRSVLKDSPTTGDALTFQDFTVTDFGTATAAIIVTSFADTQDTPEDGASMGVGFWAADGTDFWTGNRGADNISSGTGHSHGLSGTDNFKLLLPSDGSDYLEGTVSAVTNGVRLTYTTKPSSSVLIRVDLIQCDDATVLTENTSNASPSNSVTGAGFQPTAILTMHISATTNGAGWRPCFGFAGESSSTITQASVAGHTGSNNAPFVLGQAVDSAHFASRLFFSGSFRLSNYELDSFDADGFTYSQGSSSDSDNFTFYALCLRASSASFAAGVETTATSTGTKTTTAPGFPAGGGWLVPTFLDSTDTIETDTTGGAGVAGYHSFNHIEQHSASFSLEDAADPTLAHSYVSDDGFDVLDDSGVVAIEGTVAAATLGLSITTTTTDASARRFIYLVFSGFTVFESLDETVGVTEEVFGVARQALDEAMGITEEVGSFLQTVTVVPDTEAMMAGQGSYAGVAKGQIAYPRVESGQGLT